MTPAEELERLANTHGPAIVLRAMLLAKGDDLRTMPAEYQPMAEEGEQR